MASVQGPSSLSSHLRLFVDKQRNKVVVGEASADFIDALLSFLTLPLGTIIRLLSNKQSHGSAEVGCINNLYQSVQNLDTEVLWNGICKKMLLWPRNPCEKLCQKLRFNVDDTEPTKYFMCGSCRGSDQKWLSAFAGAGCSCGKLMDQEMKVVGEEDNSPKGDGVFVRGESMYLIFDDLTIHQNSACNTIQQLVQLGYTDCTKLTEISPNVGLNQIMDLLKRALISTSPLTDVFWAREAGGSQPVFSFTPILASKNVQWSDNSSYNLRVIASKSKNKILYAEAEEDFADFLFSFLTMTLGSTLKLLDGNVDLGSVHNLYKSVTDLNPSWFGRYRSSYTLSSPLLSLNVASQYGCKKQRLDVREEEKPYYYYGTGVYRNYTFYTNRDGVISKDSNKIRDPAISWPPHVNLFDPRSADGRREAVGFVRRPAILAVMDDLQVTPLTSSSSISFLQKLKVPLNDMEEHKVTIHKTEALNLLGASLTSKAALTIGLFNLLKKQKEEVI